MPKRKRSTNSVTKVSKVQEADPVLPSLDEIAEALKGESLEMVDWSPEDKAKMLESYQTKGAPEPEEYYRNKAQKTNPQTPTQEKLEPPQKPKTTPKKES
jgi:hypothetical protein